MVRPAALRPPGGGGGRGAGRSCQVRCCPRTSAKGDKEELCFGSRKRGGGEGGIHDHPHCGGICRAENIHHGERSIKSASTGCQITGYHAIRRRQTETKYWGQPVCGAGWGGRKDDGTRWISFNLRPSLGFSDPPRLVDPPGIPKTRVESSPQCVEVSSWYCVSNTAFNGVII